MLARLSSSTAVAGYSASRMSSARAASSLVFIEHSKGELVAASLSAVTAATQIGGNVTALVAGHNVGDLAKEVASIAGVDSVVVADDELYANGLPERTAKLTAAVAKDGGHTHVIAAATSVGKGVVPRVGAYHDAQPITEVIEIKGEDTFVRPIYAGNALATVQSVDSIKPLTVRGTAFAKAATEGGSASVSEAPEVVHDLEASKWVSEEVAQSDRPELTAADVIVSGGRGMQNGDNFEMLYTLADLFGGNVGASRAAVDAEFVANDLQIGQTGKIVAPELYIAVGISGAIQHVSGMKDSKTIVCINKDADAPMFQIADYGLVADLFTAVPELTEAVKVAKSA